MSDPEARDGLNVGKYKVERTDGSSNKNGKHEFCPYYVLDLKHDKFAKVALLAYADACEDEFPFLARDLRTRANDTF
jgi:hypothetical protein